MKFVRSNRWLALVANFAVVIGIILLIIELNQNQKMMKSQVKNDLSTKIVDILIQIASDDDLANLRMKGEAGDSLNLEEFYRYKHLSLAFFRYWENVHFQYRNGLYDEEEFEYHIKAIMRGFANSGMRDIWCDEQYLFTKEFREDVNERMIRLGYQCEHL